MKRLLPIALLILSTAAYCDEEDVKFSDYDRALVQQARTDEGANQFVGDLMVTGTVLFIFDLGRPNQEMDINFARFVPDEKSRKRLPNAVSGRYPSPIEYIALEPANDALVAVYGPEAANRLKHGNGTDVSAPVSLRIYRLLTDIECDSRAYWSTSFVVSPLGKSATVTGVAPHGC